MTAGKITLCALTGALALGATQVQAQVRLTPWVGSYVSTSNLGRTENLLIGEKEPTFAYGGSLDFGRVDQFLAFRLAGNYATNSDVPVEGVGCTNCETRQLTVLTATGEVLVRPLPMMPVLRPYAVLGAGIKRFDFQLDEADELLNDQTKFTAVGGIGAMVFPTNALSLFAEVSDYVSGFNFENSNDSNIRNDLFLKAGLSISLGGARERSDRANENEQRF